MYNLKINGVCCCFLMYHLGFPGGSDSWESTCNAGGLGSIPGLERPLGGGRGNPLQYSCLENPRYRGAWWATVHGGGGGGSQESDTTEGLSRHMYNLVALMHLQCCAIITIVHFPKHFYHPKQKLSNSLKITPHFSLPLSSRQSLFYFPGTTYIYWIIWCLSSCYFT